MREERYQKIRRINAELSDLPDGAFLGVMEERGIDVDDLAEFSKEWERRKDSYPKQKKRRHR